MNEYNDLSLFIQGITGEQVFHSLAQNGKIQISEFMNVKITIADKSIPDNNPVKLIIDGKEYETTAGEIRVICKQEYKPNP